VADVPFPDAQRVRAEARRAANSAWLDGLARAGLAARGVSYGLVALLAAWLAVGGRGKATSREGALGTLADHALGRVVLVLLAMGFAGYAVWRLAQAIFDKEHEGARPKGIATRATYAARGLVYLGLTYAAARLVLGARGSDSENEKARRATSEVLGWTAGTWLVAIAGLVVIGVGLYGGYRGVTQSFLEKWRMGDLSESERRVATMIGTVGLLARGLVFSLIGAFLVKAALEYDPTEAIGLDGALQKLRAQAYGQWLLGVVAVGLLAYALYDLIASRYRRV
jgi:hypothetical protein